MGIPISWEREMNPDDARIKWYNQQLILIALADGQWHRNKELKEKTKLTARTLSKHLDELEKKLNWILRMQDRDSGEYPYPVLYKSVNPKFGRFIQLVYENANDIEMQLKETKDPIQVLDDLHKINLYYFAMLLKMVQEDKSFDKD